tara:strand:+ start:3449 stop:3997 length:549 start_codon:yes stop_codon:yes gene_type:complete
MYTNDYYIQAFTSAKDTIHSLVDDVDQAIFSTPPAENKWCIGEILSHLIQTDKEYLTVLEDKILGDTSDLKKGNAPYKHPIHIRWFIKVVSPEFKRAVPTIPPFEPIEAKKMDKDRLLKEFDEIQDRYLSLIRKADKENLHLGKIKVGNPIYPIIKMSISACLAVNEAHQRRHFQQIRRILS